jgi:hypothetical protein
MLIALPRPGLSVIRSQACRYWHRVALNPLVAKFESHVDVVIVVFIRKFPFVFQRRIEAERDFRRQHSRRRMIKGPTMTRYSTVVWGPNLSVKSLEKRLCSLPNW